MKTKSLFLAALVTLGVVVSAIGKDEPRTTGLAVVPVKGSQVYKVIYRSESQSKVRMNIYGPQSQLIFTEYFTGMDGFIRPVNFSGLEAGEYTSLIIRVFTLQALRRKRKNISYRCRMQAKKLSS
jgi:hypothetical protein